MCWSCPIVPDHPFDAVVCHWVKRGAAGIGLADAAAKPATDLQADPAVKDAVSEDQKY